VLLSSIPGIMLFIHDHIMYNLFLLLPFYIFLLFSIISLDWTNIPRHFFRAFLIRLLMVSTLQCAEQLQKELTCKLSFVVQLSATICLFRPVPCNILVVVGSHKEFVSKNFQVSTRENQKEPSYFVKIEKSTRK
jgi:hypothetical protein